MNKHNRAPIFETLLSRAKRKVTSFHTPGHKNGKGLDSRLRDLSGKMLYNLDVTVFPEVDSLHDPVGPIRRARTPWHDAYC
jgi:arginine/lysine/ornithine decarboxylase